MERKELQELIAMFEHSSLSELDVTCDEYTVRMKKHVAVEMQQAVSPAPVQAPNQDTTAKVLTKIITSPIVGTFYRTPSPDAPPYVEAGDTVLKGTVLCTLEAMKLMNQLEAEYDCEIVSILADQGSLVEFGQPLFEVKPV